MAGLFGSPDKKSKGAIVTTADNNVTTFGAGSGSHTENSAKSSAGASSWFEEDDELLLSHLLLHDDGGDETENDLDAKFHRLKGRLEQDLSRVASDGDGWWTSLLNGASSSGFTCSFSPGPSPNAAVDNKDLPKAFTTPQGQLHLRALVDLLGIPQERAVKITLASLRSFASVSTAGAPPAASTPTSSGTATDPVTSPSNNDANESDKENDNRDAVEQESKLRSLLGTTELFHRVLLRHRKQFLARLRVVTESLRLEQEMANEEGGRKSMAKSCSDFLDLLDSKQTLGGSEKRGLFQLLLRLATGPPLPGLGAMELPHSVSKLLQSSGSNGNQSNSNILEGGKETLLAIQNEASEALLVLLYDRIQGGVSRLDLYLVMEAASSCSEYEFGMSVVDYTKQGGMLLGGIQGARGSGWHEQDALLGHAMEVEGQEGSSPMAVKEGMKCRLDGLWSLICAECMGLWRANNNSNGNNGEGGGWVEGHPLFSGLDLLANDNDGGDNNTAGLFGGKRASLSLETGNNAISPNKQAQKELEALCQKLRELGESVRGRRQAAYSARKQSGQQQEEDGDELWGVQAPESIALLAFGLLLKLAHDGQQQQNEFSTKIGEWGSEIAQFANDDCGAFAYLHRVLEYMVTNPLQNSGSRLNGNLKTMIGNEVENLCKRGALDMNDHQTSSLAIMDEGGTNEEAQDGITNTDDASSIVYASIGREILSATIRAFRTALLSLQSSNAAENIGMLSDLACVIYKNSNILCEGFWSDWEEFCQGRMSNDDGEEGEKDEPLCYLLDASHSLAASTLNELHKQQQQKPIIHYLKPLSTFLHLIASLCATSSMVSSVLTSEFLPDGLIGSAMSVVAALSPLVASLNQAAEGSVTAEERSTVRYATTVLSSISTLACLGGKEAREWIRKSITSSGGARMICNIAMEALPKNNNGGVERECTALSAAALNLMVNLLVDGDIAFQLETCACFATHSSSRMSAFAPFVVAGGEIALATVTILNCLSANLTRNVFHASLDGAIPTTHYVETVGAGIMAALDLLSTLVTSGEVSFPTSTIQISTCHAILSSIVSTLMGLKQVIHLHSNDEIRDIALVVRNDVINALSSSTPLGQVVAFMASAPIACGWIKYASSERELTAVMDSAAAAAQLSKGDGNRYGAWSKFVTPKRRASNASRRRRRAANYDNVVLDNAKDDSADGLYDVVVMALSLLLVWGDHAEDMSHGLFAEDGTDQQQNVFLQNSPCTLLLSRAPPSSLWPHASSSAAAATLNVANLNLISRLASSSSGGSSSKSDAALLSTKVIKMCLHHENDTADPMGLSAFRTALGGGRHLFLVLLDAFDKILGTEEEGYVEEEGMERLVLMTTTLLETVAVSVSSQPDLARAILLGGEKKKNNKEEEEDWRLVDKLVACVMSTSDLMNASRQDGTNGERSDKLLHLRSLLTCACLQVVSELWKCCRLTTTTTTSATGSLRSNLLSDSVHACGTVVAYLTNVNKTGGMASSLIANHVVELTRSSLLSIMSLEEKNSMHNEVSTAAISKKSILLDLLAHSLDIIAIETLARVQSKSQGGIKFVEDLYDSGPMECWKVLVSTDVAASSSTSSWLNGFLSAVGKSSGNSNANNWNIASFLHANPPEEGMSTSSWCSFGSAIGLAKALSPTPGFNTVGAFRQCNALHVLAQGEASFAASWATFFEVVTSNVIATRPAKDAYALSNNLAESALAALLSVSESKMISESLLSSSQGMLIESKDTTPVGELCSLLLYSLTVRRDFMEEGQQRSDGGCKNVLDMIGRLYESANKLFVMTQLGSVAPMSQEAVCLIRQRLLTSALVLMSEFESLPQEARGARHDIVKYNDLRIGFTDLAVNALQSLQYVQMGADDDAAAVVEDFAPSKYGYGFGAVSENNSKDASLLGQEAAFQLLRTSLSLLSRLAPITMGSKLGDYQTYTYGVDLAACLKERNAIHHLQYHLGTASTVASLTYQAVHSGSSTHSVAVIHNNAVEIVRLITTFFHSLTDSGSTVVDILLLLIENRCFRSLIDNPLLKTACKTWTSNSGWSAGDEVMAASVTRHRGYYTSFPRQANNTSSTSKSRSSSHKDPVHFIWREVITIFSSLLRSARCQAQTYATVDEPILRQLIPATSTVLDFVCTYEHELFSCFTSMLNEARVQGNLSSKGGKAKSSSFSSSIQSSSFAFTPNLLKESADISALFAELCKGDIKNEFARQCSGIYQRVLSTSLELTKVMSLFLGSIGNARDLFQALSIASDIMFDQQPAAMFDAHPLLSEGIPNARHEAIRNAHFAHSCCILATAEDFSTSHIATMKAVSSGKDNANNKSSPEQTFQIYVNNKIIAEVEQVAGHCLFNALSVLSDTHPASDSFISFSNEEASRLDVAAVITPGTTVAIFSRTGAQRFQRYRAQPNGGDVQYARTIGCDRSTRTISVEYSDSGTIERHVPWSWIVGMEDTSKRQCILTLPTPKSIADTDTQGPPSLWHLMLALKWCRHAASASLDNANSCPVYLTKCVAERASILLCTEVLLHDELRDRASCDDTVRKLNMQLLDLFEFTDTESTGLTPAPAVPNNRNKSLALVMGEDILGTIQKNLRSHLQSARLEREEEQKLWEENNAGWDNTSFLGSSAKRQGRRSPFRGLTRRTSSGDVS